MRWRINETTREASPSKKRRNYVADPYWFAWYPIIARGQDGTKFWVWREVVRLERRPELWNDAYGGFVRKVCYYYFTVEPDRIPSTMREPRSDASGGL